MRIAYRVGTGWKYHPAAEPLERHTPCERMRTGVPSRREEWEYRVYDGALGYPMIYVWMVTREDTRGYMRMTQVQPQDVPADVKAALEECYFRKENITV